MSQRALFSWQSTERLCTGKMTFFWHTHRGLNPNCKHLIFWRFFPFFPPPELELTLVGITVQQGCDSGGNAAEQFLLFGIMVIWGYAAYLLRPFHKYTEQRGMKCIFLNTKTTHRCTTIFFSVEKKQMSTIALKDNDHHLATEIFVHMTSQIHAAPLTFSLPSHLIIILFRFSLLLYSLPSHCLPLPLYPGGRDQQHGVRLPSIYSFRLFMLCIHNLAEASHHTHHASTSPMLPASLCVYKIMCFLSIYAPTLSFNSLLSAAGFVVHILSSLACLSAPSRQYECHVACLYSMSIIIPTTKRNSKGERERQRNWHTLVYPSYHGLPITRTSNQSHHFQQVVHWSQIETAVVAQ